MPNASCRHTAPASYRLLLVTVIVVVVASTVALLPTSQAFKLFSNSKSTVAIAAATAAARRSSLSMSSPLEEVRTDEAPAPVGPYSQAVKVGNTLYCSGQIALDPATGEFVGNGNVQEETRQVLRNMDAVLKAAGTNRQRVVRCTVFLADLADFAVVNEVYSEYFQDNAVAPSRSCVQAGALPKGAKVEIDCIVAME